jgi:hypothetical protein
VHLFRTAIQNHHAWLRLEPGRVSVTFPRSQPFFKALKRELIRGLPQDKSDDAQRLREMLSNVPLSIDQRRDHLTLALGLSDGEPIRLDCDYGPHEAQDVDSRLIQYASDLVGKLEKGTPENFVADFIRRYHPSPVD